MSTRFRQINRDTPFLLPIDMREWGPEDDFAHFALEAMDAGGSQLILSPNVTNCASDAGDMSARRMDGEGKQIEWVFGWG